MYSKYNPCAISCIFIFLFRLASAFNSNILSINSNNENKHSAFIVIIIEIENVFFDRGIPDVVAYLDFKKMKYDKQYITACEKYRYDVVFILRPWKDIFVNDKERYESFEESLEIDKYIYKTYTNFKYNIVEIPNMSIIKRKDFIINNIKNDV